MQKLRTIIFPIDFNGFLRFRGSMLGGKIDLGVSWRPLGSSRNQTEGQDSSKLRPKVKVLGVQKGSKGAPRRIFMDFLEN